MNPAARRVLRCVVLARHRAAQNNSHVRRAFACMMAQSRSPGWYWSLPASSAQNVSIVVACFFTGVSLSIPSQLKRCRRNEQARALT